LTEPAKPNFEPSSFVRVGLLFYGAMAAAAVVWRVGFYQEPMWRLSEAVPRMGVGTEIGLGVGVGLAVVALSYVFTEWTDVGERLAKAMAEPLRGLTIPDALLLASASGLAEEMLFRGALQPRSGLIVASVLFGALHFAPQRDLLPWTGFAVVMGFVLGGLFEWTGTLLAPVLAHTLINAVNLPLLVHRYGSNAAELGSFDPPDDV